MVKLNDFKRYFEVLADEMGLCFLMVVMEEHLRKKLQGKAGTIMALVYPSAMGTGSADNTVDENICLLYVLENGTKSGMTEKMEFKMYERLLEVIDGIKSKLIADADENHPLLRELERGSLEVEPEWNIAGGYNGYSLVFSFKK
ncbi:hypothetical protein [uncultured Sanguibacteroides sp.]|uniref:hypothetical protein n=1 Tax=uncultured Sanguibacteroides sp. TaxID=1635151 RepID=UPI0025D1EC29|nr:hypothetical protein [uncultured Sanguibacteroides sp.]